MFKENSNRKIPNYDILTVMVFFLVRMDHLLGGMHIKTQWISISCASLIQLIIYLGYLR